MLTRSKALDKFGDGVELGTGEQTDGGRREEDGRESIRADFDLTTDFLSWSYRRHTKTKPLKDVDVVLVLGEKEKWRRDKPPLETLQAFEKCLAKTYTEPGQVEIGRRSVSVELEKHYYPED